MLRVAPINDGAAIDQLLADPWVAARIRHDAREPGFIDHPALTYYGAYVDADLVGVFMAITHSPWEVEVHAALLRSATGHGRTLGQLFLDRLWRDPELMRITAPVLSTLPSAANYCRRLGFKDEGVKRRACKVDGQPADVIYLGLLRQR
jgi:hypothetical protein